MARNSELIRLAKKAADAWRNTHEYQQAAQIIDMLVEELESDTLTQPNEPTYPCDLCVYNPPSSLDGKPCTFCPATGRPPEGGEEEENNVIEITENL